MSLLLSTINRQSISGAVPHKAHSGLPAGIVESPRPENIIRNEGVSDVATETTGHNIAIHARDVIEKIPEQIVATIEQKTAYFRDHIVLPIWHGGQPMTKGQP